MNPLTSFSRKTSRQIVFALSLSVALGMADNVYYGEAFAARAHHSGERNRSFKVAIAPHNAESTGSGHGKRRSNFGCLPQSVQLNDVVRYGGSRNGDVTVEQTLTKMKAQCRKGRLVDAKRREIRFFRPSCWGNPPSDYRDIQERENEELEKLKTRFTVLVFDCNPMIQ
jgi:hypothetical protein